MLSDVFVAVKYENLVIKPAFSIVSVCALQMRMELPI